jgi:hypothetical protein
MMMLRGAVLLGMKAGGGLGSGLGGRRAERNFSASWCSKFCAPWMWPPSNSYLYRASIILENKIQWLCLLITATDPNFSRTNNTNKFSVLNSLGSDYIDCEYLDTWILGFLLMAWVISSFLLSPGSGSPFIFETLDGDTQVIHADQKPWVLVHTNVPGKYIHCQLA